MPPLAGRGQGRPRQSAKGGGGRLAKWAAAGGECLSPGGRSDLKQCLEGRERFSDKGSHTERFVSKDLGVARFSGEAGRNASVASGRRRLWGVRNSSGCSEVVDLIAAAMAAAVQVLVYQRLVDLRLGPSPVFVGPKEASHRTQLAFRRKGVQFHRVRDFKQYGFTGLPPASQF